MRRCRALLLWLLLAAAFGGGLAAFFWALVQVPDFYDTVLEEQPEPTARRDAAQTFERRTLQLVDGIQHSEAWSEEFTQTQINSWLAEELRPKFGQFLPPGVSEPRVQLSDATLEVGFRYQRDTWNSVVSVRVRPWVPQPNHLAFEIQAIRAGLVPIPLEHILHELSRQFETEGWRVEWSQANGNDVVILHLDRKLHEQPILEAVSVGDGTLRVAGRRGVPPHKSVLPLRKISFFSEHPETQ